MDQNEWFGLVLEPRVEEDVSEWHLKLSLTDMEVVVIFLYFDVDLHIWVVYNIPFDLYRHQLVVQDNYKTLHKLFVDVVPLPDFENCVEYGDDDKHKSKKML